MMRCRLCLQPATELLRLSMRDLNSFFHFFFDGRIYGNKLAPTCQYCWARANQCLRFIQRVQRTDFYLRTKTVNDLQIEKIHGYTQSAVLHFVVCECQQTNIPLTIPDYKEEAPVDFGNDTSKANVRINQTEFVKVPDAPVTYKDEAVYVKEEISEEGFDNESTEDVKDISLDIEVEGFQGLNCKPVSPKASSSRYVEIEVDSLQVQNFAATIPNSADIKLDNFQEQNNLRPSIAPRAGNFRGQIHTINPLRLETFPGDNFTATSPKYFGIIVDQTHRQSVNVATNEVIAITDEEKAKLYGFEKVEHTPEQQKEHMEKRKEMGRFKNAKFKCDKCFFGFHCEDMYDKHMMHHAESTGPYECPLCHYRFPLVALLLEHGLGHSRRWRCVRCGVLVARRELARHRDGCAATAVAVQCDVCGKSYMTKMRLHRHKLRHDMPKRYVCDYCEKGYHYKFELTQHIRLHTRETPYACTECQQKFRTMGTLSAHINMKHKPPQEEECEASERYCAPCDKLFKSRLTYQSHVKTSRKHVPHRFRFICDICSKSFLLKSQLRMHIEAEHLKLQLYDCKQCDKKYYRKSALRVHLRNAAAHRTGGEPAHVCELCGVSFKSKKIVAAHIVARHEKRRPYECKTCGDRFGYSGALFTHNKLKHEGGTRQRAGRGAGRGAPANQRRRGAGPGDKCSL